MKWFHTRKGKIEGEIVEDDGTWVKIKLTKEIHLGARHGYCGPGEVATVRKSFLQPLEEQKEA